MYEETIDGLGVSEIVDPETYTKMGTEAWSCIHSELLTTYQQLRAYFEKKHPGSRIVINTWHDSDMAIHCGYFRYRGFRNPLCTTGATNSAHKQGKAIDFDIWVGVRRLEPHDVRTEIIANKALFPALLGIESNTNWIHCDCMDRPGYKPGMICLFDADGSYSWV